MNELEKRQWYAWAIGKIDAERHKLILELRPLIKLDINKKY